jgi:dipeptidyl aminopeptidase/acylaminoacyl peptidase
VDAVRERFAVARAAARIREQHHVARGGVAQHLGRVVGAVGGVLTAWIVGKTDRFRAAVSAKPIVNFTSMALTSDFPNGFVPYWFAKPVWEDFAEYWRRSPLSLVGKVKTPTMLMTGELDYRTPISEAEQFYTALRLRKIDTALVRVPEASHGIVDRPSRLIAKTDNIVAWFERYRSGAAAAAKPEAAR